MHIEQVRIKNFKSIRGPVALNLSNLTFLYGPNSAGKSSVMDALNLLRRLCEQSKSIMTFEELISLGEHSTAGAKAGLSIGVSIALSDGRDLATVGTSQFDGLPKTLEALVDGSIDLDIELARSTYPNPVSSLDISIGGEPLIAYRESFTKLGPYLKLAQSDVWEALDIKNDIGLHGEWLINRDHPLAEELILRCDTNGARSSLAFPSHPNSSTHIVRGLSFEFGRELLMPVIASDSIEFILPPDSSKIVSEYSAWSRLYHDGHLKFIPETDDWDDISAFSHKNFLNQFELGADECSKYSEFLEEEFCASKSLHLLQNLKHQSELISKFLSAIFLTVGRVIEIPRVPGRRLGFDSSKPLHIKSLEQFHDGLQPYEKSCSVTGNELLEIQRPSYEWEAGLTWRILTPEFNPAIARLVAPYAAHLIWGVTRSDEGDETKADADFPNYCLRKYLHSLGNYRVDINPYRLESCFEYAHEDGTQLADSWIVYFQLKDQRGMTLDFSEVGSALGYVFPILAGLGELDALCIEQPELHLHPMAQDQLMDVFIHAAETSQYFPTRNHKRLIIESHSEIFLLRLSQRIAQTWEHAQSKDPKVAAFNEDLSISNEHVRIYYFNPIRSGVTEVEEIMFAPDGKLVKTWPSGMFPTDWTSGLDRLKLFSDSFTDGEAEAIWPWLSRVDDPEIYAWLKTAILLEQMNETMLDSEVVCWGRIVEKVLTDMLLKPIKEELLPTEDSVNLTKRQKDFEQTLIKDFKDNDRFPNIGWWARTLEFVRHQEGREPDYVRTLRRHLQREEFSLFWKKGEADVLFLIKALWNARNNAAHAGKVDEFKAQKARQLVSLNRNPGILFQALGLYSLPKQGPQKA